MNPLVPTDKASAGDPVSRLADYLGALRKKHIISRLIFILSVGLWVDLLYNITAITLYNALDVRISVPFFFELFIVILLAREIPGWRIEKLAADLDNRFQLKDRLYSFIWYSRHSMVPADIRTAQAKESLSAINFPQILYQTRIRFPYYLSIALVLTCTLLYLAWNEEYRPPGVATRIITSTLAPKQPQTNTGPDLTRQSTKPTPQSSAVLPDLPEPGSDGEEMSSSTQPDSRDGEKGTTTGDLPEPETAQIGVDPVSDGSAGSGQAAGTRQAGGKGQPGATDAPDTIASVLESETVSEPVPPSLRNSSSYAFKKLPDATRFLSLIPGQAGPSLAPLNGEIVSNFEEGIETFPDLYRDHLQSYYREMKKWDKKP